MVEITQINLLSLCSVWKPAGSDGCSTRNIAICLILLAFFLSIIWFQPYNSPLDKIFATIINGTMFFAVLSMTIAISANGSKPLMDLASYLLLISALLMMIKGIYDILLYMLDLWLGRRRTAVTAGKGTGGGGYESSEDITLPIINLATPEGTEVDEVSVYDEGTKTDLSSRSLRRHSSSRNELSLAPLLELLHRDAVDVTPQQRTTTPRSPLRGKLVLI
eukprot:TRINITY_DN10702_c0_g1_i1.p1 TRINITY_DN10702_c0_g1~~TRINITY_DN10702_c0_g1_i1.p1  ORF type:complete len:244 (+),score=33.69 TRINITY_DN10702_c0_g1_i1:74-733(+)